MTYKTDLKFGLLILIILLGTFFFAARAIHSDRLIGSEVEAQLRLHMTRGEVEKIFRGHRGWYTVSRSSNSFVCGFQDPEGGLSKNYHFYFDNQSRLTSVFVDDEFRPGYFENRTVALK